MTHRTSSTGKRVFGYFLQSLSWMVYSLVFIVIAKGMYEYQYEEMAYAEILATNMILFLCVVAGGYLLGVWGSYLVETNPIKLRKHIIN